MTYSIDGIMYAECLERPSNIIRSGATFTFKEPRTEAEEHSVVAVGRQSYAFTIHPNNESLVTCALPDSGESDSVKVAVITIIETISNYTAIPQYTAGVIAIKWYAYSDNAVVDIECPFQLGRLRELYEISWNGVIGDDIEPMTNGSLGVYWLTEEISRILHVDFRSAPGSLRNF